LALGLVLTTGRTFADTEPAPNTGGCKSCCICRYQEWDDDGKKICETALEKLTCDIKRAESNGNWAHQCHENLNWDGCTGNRTFINGCHGCDNDGERFVELLQKTIDAVKTNPKECKEIVFVSLACKTASRNDWLLKVQAICQNSLDARITCRASPTIITTDPQTGEVDGETHITVCGGCGTKTTIEYPKCDSPDVLPPHCGRHTLGVTYVCDDGKGGTKNRVCCKSDDPFKKKWQDGKECPKSL